MTFDADELGRLIRARRTTKLLDPDTPVDPTVIEELCALATWAPNHKRTEPWRFAVFTGDGRRVLGETIADALQAAGGHEAKILKTRTKYLRSAAVVLVGSTPGPDEMTTAEPRRRRCRHQQLPPRGDRSRVGNVVVDGVAAAVARRRRTVRVPRRNLRRGRRLPQPPDRRGTARTAFGADDHVDRPSRSRTEPTRSAMRSSAMA